MNELIPTHYVTYEPADEKTIVERQSICSQCDDFDSETTKCAVCHCPQSKKWTLIESKCPVGKWK